MAGKTPVDLIILDMMLPGVDGYEVLRLLKSDPKLAHIPVALFTAGLDRDGVSQAMEMGAIAHLRKPFEPRAFGERVHTLLEAGAA